MTKGQRAVLWICAVLAGLLAVIEIAERIHAEYSWETFTTRAIVLLAIAGGLAFLAMRR